MKFSRIAAVATTAAAAAVLFTACTSLPHRSLQPEAGCHRRASLEACLEAARASYAYLFFAPHETGEREARDLYNQATERVTTLLFDNKEALSMDSWTIRRGVIDVRLPEGRPLADLIPASRLSFEGLRNVYRRDGFGAEFVAVAADHPASGEEEIGFVAASVVLRFAGSSFEEVMATRDVTLEAYDSTRHESLSLYGREVPLAANFTAPYALWLERSHFGRQAKRALVRRDEELLEPRVFQMQPFDPDRRTVVLIHGLASSPRAWVDLGNELMGDEEIRRNYQVWEVFYRSGAPIAYNVDAIRRALEETLSRFDPNRASRASQRMVLVGHSMGGVIARLLVLDAGDALWRGLLGHAPDDEQRRRLASLSPYLDLQPMPEVGRAVFLASPHRGAPMAGNQLGRAASRLIRLPDSLMRKAGEIADTLEGDAPEGAARVRAGSDGVDFLNDRRPYLETAAGQPIAPWVTYHSIVACKTLPPPGCTDGLVPYASAHLDGAASERIVRSGHSVQQTPEAIHEMRRILHLHLEEP